MPKFTELTELIAPESADTICIVDDTAGTPTSKKVTKSNFLSGGTEASPDLLNGVKSIPSKLAVGNATDLVGHTVEGLEISNIYDDYAGGKFATQLYAVTGVTGTTALAPKLVTGLFGHSLASMDAGTDVNTYYGGVEVGVSFDPDSAYTLPEYRCYESDPTFSSGTCSKVTGFNARMHFLNTGTTPLATITDFVGFHAFGAQDDFSASTVTNFTGFLVESSQKNTLNVAWTDWIGMRIDNIDKINALGTLTVSNDAIGIWLNGYGDSSNIVFGDNKEFSLSATDNPLGASTQLVAETAITDITANSQCFVAKLHLSGDPSTRDAAALNGICDTTGLTASGTGAQKCLGGDFVAWFNSAGSHTIPLGIGVRGYPLITNVASTVTDSIGVLAGATVKTFGTVTNATSLKVEKNTAGATVNEGIWMAGDDIGADISFGAGRDVQMHFNGVNLELEGSGIAHTSIGAETLTGYVTIAIDGVARKIAVVS